MRGLFEPAPGGVTIRLDAVQIEVITAAATQAEALISTAKPAAPTSSDDPEAAALAKMVGIAGADPGRPDDPVLARLFPDPYDPVHVDSGANADYRRYTRSRLVEGKLAALKDMCGALAPGTVTLSADEGEVWLTALNDCRITLAGQLEITTDEDAEELSRATPRNPRFAQIVAYQYLGLLQETLIEALDAVE